MGWSPHDGATRRRRQRSDVVDEGGGRGGAGWPRCSSSRRRISTGVAGIDRRRGNPARSRGSDGTEAWRTSCLLHSRVVMHRATTTQEERGPARGRAHGGSRRGRGDEGPDEIASPWEVGPSTVLDNATARRIRGIRALILRGRCPRQRSISPGAARWQRKREPRSKP